MITFDEIIKIHKQLWPDMTFEQQCNKYAEEAYEESMAPNDNEHLLELADMFIASAGVARFDYATGLTKLQETLNRCQKYNIDDLLNAVEQKMEKNKKRIWEKVDGVGYHHIDE